MLAGAKAQEYKMGNEQDIEGDVVTKMTENENETSNQKGAHEGEEKTKTKLLRMKMRKNDDGRGGDDDHHDDDSDAVCRFSDGTSRSGANSRREM